MGSIVILSPSSLTTSFHFSYLYTLQTLLRTCMCPPPVVLCSGDSEGEFTRRDAMMIEAAQQQQLAYNPGAQDEGSSSSSSSSRSAPLSCAGLPALLGSRGCTPIVFPAWCTPTQSLILVRWQSGQHITVQQHSAEQQSISYKYYLTLTMF